MLNRKYIIIKHTQSKVWIIINTYDDTTAFRSELEQDLQAIGIKYAEVFFDFVIQSGRYNRFLYGIFSNRKLTNGIKPVTDNIQEISSIFNSYLYSHKEVIGRSMLSTREKRALLQSL